MRDLNVVNIKFLEVATLSIGEKLPPRVRFVFGRVLGINELFQRLNNGGMRWVEEDSNGISFLFAVYHSPVLHTLILLIAPNLLVQQCFKTIDLHSVSKVILE